MQSFKTPTCLIYGGGGFIGSHLAEELVKMGYHVRIFEIKHFDGINLLPIIDQVEIIEGDFHNKVDIRSSLQHVDYVFHLVSSTIPSVSMANPLFDVESNLVSSINLFQECINRRRVKKLVFISSGGTVYGIPQSIPIGEDHPTRPLCSYGIIKNTIEQYCHLYNKLYGLNCSIFRLSNPYGERQNPFAKQGVIPIFLNKINSFQEIEIWGDGEVVRDYIYIKDVVGLIAQSIGTETGHSVYNVGSGKGVSLNELVEIMKEVTGLPAKVKYLHERSFDVACNVLDITRAKNDYSWEPAMDLETGIRRVYDYLLNTYPRPRLEVEKMGRGEDGKGRRGDRDRRMENGKVRR